MGLRGGKVDCEDEDVFLHPLGQALGSLDLAGGFLSSLSVN